MHRLDSATIKAFRDMCPPSTAPPPQLGEGEGVSGTVSHPSRVERHATARARRILVVDDDPGIRTIMSSLLANAGFLVNIAGDGEEGWEAFSRSTYDLLITDQDMPKLNGLDLIARIRQYAPGIPVILMSGSLASMPAGAPIIASPDVFLTKPFSPARLVKEVIRQLSPV